MSLFVPGASEVKSTAPVQETVHEPNRDEDTKDGLVWPVRGKIVSEFGVKDGVEQNGIRIQAPEGSPVRAAADGKVGYAGSIAGLGTVVLLEHADRLVTVYAHLKEIRVTDGQTVKRGSVIGAVGRSGRVEAPSLYFEVRSRSKPENPMPLLESVVSQGTLR